MLQGCITALITPMNNSGDIDFDALQDFIEWQIESGVTGLVVNGSTGEAATLSEIEKIKLIKFVISKVDKRVAIIVGSGTASTEATLDFVQKVNNIDGVDYLMCLTPYYVKPTQEGLYLHFQAVAKSSKYPVILYNVPGRTGCNLDDKTTLRLAREHANIVGLKDATGDIRRALYLIANKPSHFTLLSGDDATALAVMLCGGAGVISVVSNIRPKQYVTMCNLAIAGDTAKANEINRLLIGLYDLLFVEANPIPVKWGLYFEGRIKSAFLRLPLTELSSNYRTRLEECLAEISG